MLRRQGHKKSLGNEKQVNIQTEEEVYYLLVSLSHKHTHNNFTRPKLYLTPELSSKESRNKCRRIQQI